MAARVTSGRTGGKHSAVFWRCRFFADCIVQAASTGTPLRGLPSPREHIPVTVSARGQLTPGAGGFFLSPRCSGCTAGWVLRDSRHPIVSGRLGTGARGCARGSCRIAQVGRHRAIGSTRCARRNGEAGLAEGKTSSGETRHDPSVTGEGGGSVKPRRGDLSMEASRIEETGVPSRGLSGNRSRPDQLEGGPPGSQQGWRGDEMLTGADTLLPAEQYDAGLRRVAYPSRADSA